MLFSKAVLAVVVGGGSDHARRGISAWGSYDSYMS